jgi:nitrite reductase (NADH) large subunit
VHFVSRVGLDYVKKRVLADAQGRRDLWDRLQFAIEGEPDPWHEPARAGVDPREFIPIAPMPAAQPGRPVAAEIV